MMTYIRVGHPLYSSMSHDVALGRLNYFYHPSSHDDAFTRWIAFIRIIINNNHNNIHKVFKVSRLYEAFVDLSFKFGDSYKLIYSLKFNLETGGGVYISEERVDAVPSKSQKFYDCKNIFYRSSEVKFRRQGQRKLQRFKTARHQLSLGFACLDDPRVGLVRDYINNITLIYPSSRWFMSCHDNDFIGDILGRDAYRFAQWQRVIRSMFDQTTATYLADLIHRERGSQTAFDMCDGLILTTLPFIAPPHTLVILSDIDGLQFFPIYLFQYISKFLSDRQFIVSFKSEEVLRSVLSLREWDGFFYDHHQETGVTDVYYIKGNNLPISNSLLV